MTDLESESENLTDLESENLTDLKSEDLTPRLRSIDKKEGHSTETSTTFLGVLR